MSDAKPVVVLDTETYPNYFLAKFYEPSSGRIVGVEMFTPPEVYNHRDYALIAPKLNVGRIRAILERYCVHSFNGIHYDLPMLTLAMSGADNRRLKFASDAIINSNEGRGLRAWEFYREFGLQEPTWIDHVDMIEVVPGDGSLKLYGGRLHSKRLQDLPYEPERILTREEADFVSRYCDNDLHTTDDMRVYIKKALDLRVQMSAMYGLDLRSKSDAQIAEAVIKKEVGAKLGIPPSKPMIPAGTVFHYKPPTFLRFKTRQMQQRLAAIAQSAFVVGTNGSPIEPDSLADVVEQIGIGQYRLGIGGLHSSEKSRAYLSDDEFMLMDIDVTSYYPSIILQCGLFPRHLTEVFLEVYRKIFDTRVQAKKAGNDTVANVLKIVLNGSFGKFGSYYSTLYSPDLMIQVTVTGQLALLMLIETLTLDGIAVISANTDGIVLRFKRSRLEDVRAHVKAWEKATGFGMEETHYRLIASRDVNNYIAITTDGKVKGKGAFADIGISKNPSNAICVDAVRAFLKDGTPIPNTIYGCTDIRKFLTVQRVTGGAVKILRTSYDDTLKPSGMKKLLLEQGWHIVVDGPMKTLRLGPPDDPSGALGEGYDVQTAYRMHCGEDEFEFVGKVVRFYIGRNAVGPLRYRKKNKSGNRNAVPDSDGAVPLMELPDEFPTDINYERYVEEAVQILVDIGVWRK